MNHSGDSDSTASIAGNILGAFYGERCLPADWLAALAGAGGHPGHGLEAGRRHWLIASAANTRPGQCTPGVESSGICAAQPAASGSRGPACPRDMPRTAPPRRTCPSLAAASSGHAHLWRRGLDILPMSRPVRASCEGHVHAPDGSATQGHVRSPHRCEGHVHPWPRHPQDMPISGGGDWTYCHYVHPSEPPEDMSPWRQRTQGHAQPWRPLRRNPGAPDLSVPDPRRRGARCCCRLRRRPRG